MDRARSYGPRQSGYRSGNDRLRAAPRRDDVADVELNSLEDAEAVVDKLGELIQTYDHATVADYYAACNVPSTYVDNSWGWTDIRDVNIQQTRDGWVIDLPRIEPIR